MDKISQIDISTPENIDTYGDQNRNVIIRCEDVNNGDHKLVEPENERTCLLDSPTQNVFETTMLNDDTFVISDDSDLSISFSPLPAKILPSQNEEIDPRKIMRTFSKERSLSRGFLPQPSLSTIFELSCEDSLESDFDNLIGNQASTPPWSFHDGNNKARNDLAINLENFENQENSFDHSSFVIDFPSANLSPILSQQQKESQKQRQHLLQQANGDYQNYEFRERTNYNRLSGMLLIRAFNRLRLLFNCFKSFLTPFHREG